jgi:hypothetical protein
MNFVQSHCFTLDALDWDEDIEMAGVAMAVKPIPEGYHAVTLYLVATGASKLVDFLKQAFDAQEMFRIARPRREHHGFASGSHIVSAMRLRRC